MPYNASLSMALLTIVIKNSIYNSVINFSSNFLYYKNFKIRLSSAFVNQKNGPINPTELVGFINAL